MLTGRYGDAAKLSYKTVEGRALLDAVRRAVKALDGEMSTPIRGERISHIVNALELAADIYDLYGEKDRRRKRQYGER